MWIVNALLIFVAWTAVGLAAAVLLSRLGFGSEVRRSRVDLASQLLQRERERRAGGHRRHPREPDGRGPADRPGHDGRPERLKATG
jgi:hypothetical protein